MLPVKPTTANKKKKKINSLRPKHSCGYGTISTKVLKSCIITLVPHYVMHVMIQQQLLCHKGTLIWHIQMYT